MGKGRLGSSRDKRRHPRTAIAELVGSVGDRLKVQLEAESNRLATERHRDQMVAEFAYRQSEKGRAEALADFHRQIRIDKEA